MSSDLTWPYSVELWFPILNWIDSHKKETATSPVQEPMCWKVFHGVPQAWKILNGLLPKCLHQEPAFGNLWLHFQGIPDWGAGGRLWRNWILSPARKCKLCQLPMVVLRQRHFEECWHPLQTRVWQDGIQGIGTCNQTLKRIFSICQFQHEVISTPWPSKNQVRDVCKAFGFEANSSTCSLEKARDNFIHVREAFYIINWTSSSNWVKSTENR